MRAGNSVKLILYGIDIGKATLNRIWKKRTWTEVAVA